MATASLGSAKEYPPVQKTRDSHRDQDGVLRFRCNLLIRRFPGFRLRLSSFRSKAPRRFHLRPSDLRIVEALGKEVPNCNDASRGLQRSDGQRQRQRQPEQPGNRGDLGNHRAAPAPEIPSFERHRSKPTPIAPDLRAHGCGVSGTAVFKPATTTARHPLRDAEERVEEENGLRVTFRSRTRVRSTPRLRHAPSRSSTSTSTSTSTRETAFHSPPIIERVIRSTP
jgi:hypothetical protein